MTQPFAEWLAEVKMLLATHRNPDTALYLGGASEANVDKMRGCVKDAVECAAVFMLARAVEELEKPVVVTDEMVERACIAEWSEQHWGTITTTNPRFAEAERKTARVALEAALRREP